MDLLCRRRPPAFIATMLDEMGGHVFECDLRDAISREVCFTGRYEPQGTAIVQAVLRPGMAFVDVGANWGYFTLLAAHLVGKSGRVVSLEPDPRLFPVLHRNLLRNCLGHVTALQVAAAGESGFLGLSGYDETGDNFGVSYLVGNNSRARSTYLVAAQPLDDVLEELQLTAVDLVKMDIEGGEGLALQGMTKSLKRQVIHRLLLELHPHQLIDHGHKVEDIFRQLLDCGYIGLSIDYSPEANRRAAYSKRVNPQEFLRPLSQPESSENWPHLLWVKPGVAPLG